MSVTPKLSLSWSAAVLLAAVLLVAGAAGSYLWMRRVHTSSGASTPASVPAAPAPEPPRAEPAGHTGPLPDLRIVLPPEAVERAGIAVAPVRTAAGGASMRLPGIVQPNAYRQVTVTPLVTGQVTRVLVELGQRVQRGQTMAEVYSPELADTQTRYLTMRAELEAVHQELRRTEQLVEIGAASQQELEQVRAKHTTHATDVEGARSRLRLLGMGAAAIDRLTRATEISSTAAVLAPINGVVTERTANTGLNVEPSTSLFTIVDLSMVWVIADVYEKDFARVRVGDRAQVTTAAYPGLVLQGRVSYIDPQVNPDTRTAKARIEVGNPRGELRLGMYGEVVISGAGGPAAALVPREAVQNVGDRQVVYLADPKQPGAFTEREVRLGVPIGGDVEVLGGLEAGDVVVSEGSFFIRAERERLGLRATPAASSGGAKTPGGSPAAGTQTARVAITDHGFEPARLSLKPGVPARITFVRNSDKTCATAVQIPALKVSRELPLNQPVTIDVVPQQGELQFACGMDMLRGSIVAQ